MCALARLSFWVSAERMGEFEKDYAKRLVPILKAHELLEAGSPERVGVGGVFSRLFEVATPKQIPGRGDALEHDAAWTELLSELGGAYAEDDPAGPMPFSLRLYSTPAGPGTTTEIGPGFRQRLWHSFGVQDVLPDSIIYYIMQDLNGDLWIEYRFNH